MKKRLLSVILTLCVMLTLLPTTALAGTVTNYGIWVGSTEVTSENMNNVLGDTGTPTVIYDADQNILTLNNANITTTKNLESPNDKVAITRDLSSSLGLNINLIGNNTIDLSSVNIGISGVYGINHNQVNIQSTTGGSLSIIGPSQMNGYICGISSTHMKIENCTVKVTTGNSTGDSCDGIAITLNGSLSIKNATVTATAGDANVGSHGIQVNKGFLSIEHSIVTANGRNSGNSAYGSYGIITLNDTSTTISASTVTATGKTSALWFHGATAAPVPTATGHTTTASANIGGTGVTVVTLNTSVYGAGSTYKYVQIAPAPARWGAAGSDGAAPTAWTQGTLAEAMTYANGLGSGTTAYIQLLTNIDKNNNTTWPLTFDSGHDTVLDLNGNDIDRGLTAAISNGNVIKIAGTALTLKDSSTDVLANQGKITGGFNSGWGGCVFVESKTIMNGMIPETVLGSFTMESGNITGNKTTSANEGGGGVLVASSGSFVMTGGSIAGNEARNWGGGVYVENSGSFVMTGGSITGNKSANGGVFTDGTSFTVGGTAVIEDNITTDASPGERNVCPSNTGKTISVSTAAPLTTGASIGVTTAAAPTSGNPVNVTGTNSNDYSGYFFSDDSRYVTQDGTDHKVQLVPAPPVSIGKLKISASFTAGHNLTLSELTAPTVTPKTGVTITAQGWQIPNGLGDWTNWSEGGVLPLDTSGTFKLRYYVTYNGDSGSTTITSNEVTLTVVGKTTTLVLTASPASPQSAGTPVTLTATLTGFFAGPGVTGQTITFKNGTTTLGTESLKSGGVATYTWMPSTAGTYSLTAEYAATSYNAAATSNTLSYTVNVALPTASTYAADAASGTDYVLDTTNKILTIKTEKGAAFWSASDTDYLNYNILLAKNVDVGGFKWTPVGDSSPYFTGTFDGQGHSITGLTASADSYAGLFSHAVNATIKNLCLSGSVTINNSVDGSYGGALVGYATKSTIANCCSHTDVTASSSGTASAACAGGLVGIADSATAITNCFNTGSIRATVSGVAGSYAYAGGIAGYNYDNNVNVINCYSIGSVTAANASDNYAGGVVGYISGTVKNCYYLNSAADKGIGTVRNSPTITGCGTIGSDKTTLTAGTADQFVSAQTLAYTGTLLENLNSWVNNAASADYRTWQADSGNTNGGYPVLNVAWGAIGSLDLTGVSCNVAAGTITGTTTSMQYSLDGGTTWRDCAAGDTTGLIFAAGTVKVRQKDKPTNDRTIITLAPAVTSNAPTLGSKTSSSVTLTAVTGYEYSKDGGVTWQDSNSFSGLSSGTAYSFVARIKATATTLPGTVSTALSVTTSNASSGDGTGSGSGTSSGTGAPVIVDGKTENIGTEKKTGDTTTVTVDQSKLGTNIGGAASGSSVVVPVSENGSATASLVVKNIEDMAAKGMTLTVQTGAVAYNLNTSAIDTAALAEAFPGADMSTVPFNVTITNSSVSVEGETLVLSPVEFTVTATYNGKFVSVDTFSAYIDRVIEVTAEQAAKITTAVVVNADGSVRHVPTNVIEKDGKYYAAINSRTNSTYALIQNEVTFADAKGKWYEAVVNEMGSRKIIEGRSSSVFDGEASITRAEFAAILIRALGLPAYGASSFSDVPATAWYSGAVATAVQYKLVEGKGENRFDPNVRITRQEVMAMLQRVASLTEFTGTSGNLDSFADAGSVGAWALDAAKWSVGSGLIQGAGGKLNPTANITRAESATIILRLLQKAGLVDVRTEA